jgi:hypothetical protein
MRVKPDISIQPEDFMKVYIGASSKTTNYNAALVAGAGSVVGNEGTTLGASDDNAGGFRGLTFSSLNAIKKF